jgi:very-short-patch-repair endonuclease
VESSGDDSLHRFHPLSLERARAMRADSAPAEQILWQHLRGRRLDGVKFRRQVPVGPYVVDFVCHETKLVVELDGASHEERVEHDAERTAYLGQQGLRVIRFLNEDVHRDVVAVLRTILRECGRSPD